MALRKSTIGPMLLICNAMLPVLAILLAVKAFRDHDSIDSLFALELVKGEIIYLCGRIAFLTTFKSLSSRNTAEKTETASALSKQLRALGFRIGRGHIRLYRRGCGHRLRLAYTLRAIVRDVGRKATAPSIALSFSRMKPRLILRRMEERCGIQRDGFVAVLFAVIATNSACDSTTLTKPPSLKANSMSSAGKNSFSLMRRNRVLGFGVDMC
ncbi:hypothetical protein LY76DRAFT_172316 [Colletotrichum caudatum]|nr:hypothetical protein LY76DRAFT_172316 [Colletotrichum caudatum]